MANLDHLQAAPRASMRLYLAQFQKGDEAAAEQNQDESQTDPIAVAQSPNRTPTTQLPSRKRTAPAPKRKPAPAPRATKIVPPSNTRERKAKAPEKWTESLMGPPGRGRPPAASKARAPKISKADTSRNVAEPNPASSASTRKNTKRKLSACDDAIAETTNTSKQVKLSPVPASNAVVVPENGTPTAQTQHTDGGVGDRASRESSPLSSAPSSPILTGETTTAAVFAGILDQMGEAAGQERNQEPLDAIASSTERSTEQVQDANPSAAEADLPNSHEPSHDPITESNSELSKEGETESNPQTPPSMESQTFSADEDDTTTPATSVNADSTEEAKGEPELSLTATPPRAVIKTSQLLTPPGSGRRSDDGERASPQSERPKRNRKRPELLGDIVPTESAVDAVEEGFDSAVSAREERADSPASAIEVTKWSPPMTPKATTSRRKSSSASTKTKQSSRQSKAPAAKVLTPTTSKVTKSRSRAKAAPTPQKKSTTRAQLTPKTNASSSRRNSKSAAARPEVSQSPTATTSRKTKVTRRESLIVVLPLPRPDAQQLALSQALTKREPLASKPKPQGQPEVWAESRQALCETLPYFKKPQGGCYQNDGHVYGFLFDSVGHCREYMDEDVIICRAGGSMESDSNGGMVQRKDQSLQEAQVQAVLNDIAHHNPVVVICGNRNEKAPCKMPHQYCVLGWYKPVAVWSEKTAGKGTKVWTTVKYRLERLNHHKPAWHAPQESKTQDNRSMAGELATSICENCHQENPQVYLRNWICLNQNCDRFWKINGCNAPLGSEGMEYNPAFLLHRSKPWASEFEQNEPEPSSLRPALPNFGNAIGDNLTYINTRGICCPNCGRCSSRRLFSGWVCENTACDFRLPAAHQPINPAMLHTPWDSAPTLVRNRHVPNVHLEVEHKHGYKISTYTFEGIDGRFIHAAATTAVVQEKDGADEMFRIMQTENMGLERRTFAGKKMSGGRGGDGSSVTRVESNAPELPAELNSEQDEELSSDKKPEFADGDLMTAFSMNYGMPYKFVAGGASKSFDSAPEAVREARRRLNWASQAFLQTPEEEDLNELLIFAYLQGQKIEYHDDGEEGLGPRIATLSLGGRAKMHMRMKMKHHVGCSKTGLLTEERPIPGSMAYPQRLEVWNELHALRTTDPAAYGRRRKEIPKEIGIFDKRNKKAEDLVTISLSHGDLVLMDGYAIQKYLEHKVVPEDHLRFALTCRTVLEGHLKEEERPEYVVERDVRVYTGPSGL